MNKYRYKINNLDCANCARKIEDSLNKNKDFKNVKVNFNTMMISYETEKNISISGVNKLIKKIEPEAYISENEENVKKRISFKYTYYCFSCRFIWILFKYFKNN